MPRRAQYSLLGAGNNGAVLQGTEPGTVIKYTRDPIEVQTWLAVAALRRKGRRLDGLPYHKHLYIGDRAAVIVREDIKPLGKQHGLDPGAVTFLQRGGRLVTRSVVGNDRRALRAAQRDLTYGLGGPLRTVNLNLRELARLGARPGDLRPDNFGWAARGLVLHDPGRGPIETTVAKARGEYDACPNVRKLASAVHDVINHAPDYKSCGVVTNAGMRRVMRKHGWRDAEINDTAGFHSQDNRIYLLRGNEWSLLHELVHAAGVIDRDLASWATEGITEATAMDIAKAHKLDHRPTYPGYVKIVRKTLAPAVGVKPVQLAEIVASQPQRAGRNLADRLETRTGKPARDWYKVLGPGSTGPEPFLRLSQ